MLATGVAGADWILSPFVDMCWGIVPWVRLCWRIRVCWTQVVRIFRHGDGGREKVRLGWILVFYAGLNTWWDWVARFIRWPGLLSECPL